MKKVILFLFVAILATSCNSQETKTKHKAFTKLEISKDSTKQPKEQWKVNKEVDENGNVIRYDSIYSWSSSGNFKNIDKDSILNHMQSMMQSRFSMIQDSYPDTFKERDSIMNNFFSDDFFKEDFFSNGLQGFSNMDEMMKRMEAIQQQFFKHRNNYIIPPETLEENKKQQL